MMLRCNVCLNFKTSLISTICIFALIFSAGCASIMSSATSDMMSHLSHSILNNDDLKIVEDGAPAYLIMIDSLISKDPQNKKMLYTASNLYGSYASLFVKDVWWKNTCGLQSKPFEEFEQIIKQTKKEQLPALFALGNAWARWIMANTDDFNAIADIAYIELIMERVTELDETYQDGAAYLYLGTLSSFLPPALGGKPEKAKSFFEKALSISQGKNLMVNVLYAKFYARMMFDQELHDQLLDHVLKADPYIPGYTLMNTWAKQQAQELNLSAKDYF